MEYVSEIHDFNKPVQRYNPAIDRDMTTTLKENKSQIEYQMMGSGGRYTRYASLRHLHVHVHVHLHLHV